MQLERWARDPYPFVVLQMFDNFTGASFHYASDNVGDSDISFYSEMVAPEQPADIDRTFVADTLTRLSNLPKHILLR